MTRRDIVAQQAATNKERETVVNRFVSWFSCGEFSVLVVFVLLALFQNQSQEVKIKKKLITSQLWMVCQHLTSKISQDILDSMEEIFVGPTTRH